jgi:hypothetical protein
MEIGLAEAVAAVRAELTKAQDEGKDELLQFAVGPIEMEFQVVATRGGQANAKVRIYVVEVGGSGKIETTSTHRVKISLTPHSDKGEPLDIRRRQAEGSE